ncbi:MAG: cobalamin biosynthesis protein CobD [Rhodospirillaceae bacterium]|nr:cobalamin biosynthesis protein CobD [Alphaproteobacteria bacterium]MBR72922.1 cobalamin biosynthesis protein CobD [Rhodospirillaceae bacterium]|tara:strand:+ start:8851 stop:9906 length:1056 start_codon:yes stop_codon:yes gene_type:complete
MRLAPHSLVMENFGIWHSSNIIFIDWLFVPGVFVVLILALILDAIIGDPRWIPHPVRGIGVIIKFFDSIFNRAHYPKHFLRIFGFGLVVIITIVFITVGWVITFYTAGIPFGWIIELVIIMVMISQRSMIDHAWRVGRALKSENLEVSREKVGHIVGRDVATLDKAGVSRAAIESISESFTDGVVAPIFWYLVGGLPGLLVFKAISTLDSMVGYRNPKYLDFGMAAARFDDILNWFPARIAGPIIALAAFFIPKASSIGAFYILFRDASKHNSPNAGWAEAAMAGALRIRLLGPRMYKSIEVLDASWIGDGKKEATFFDLLKAIHIYAISCFILWVGIFMAIIFIKLLLVK